MGLKEKDDRVKIIKLSRNFGFDGITVGLDKVQCDAAIVMTANLQDDPKVIQHLSKNGKKDLKWSTELLNQDLANQF